MVKAKVKEWAGSYRIEAEQNKDEAKDRLLKKVIIKESGALQMWEWERNSLMYWMAFPPYTFNRDLAVHCSRVRSPHLQCREKKVHFYSFMFLSIQVEVKWKCYPQSCLTLCDSMDCIPPGSSVHGILQPRTLEWVAIPYSKDHSQPKDGTRSPALQILYHLSHQGSPNRNHYDRLSQKWKLWS